MCEGRVHQCVNISVRVAQLSLLTNLCQKPPYSWLTRYTDNRFDKVIPFPIFSQSHTNSSFFCILSIPINPFPQADIVSFASSNKFDLATIFWESYCHFLSKPTLYKSPKKSKADSNLQNPLSQALNNGVFQIFDLLYFPVLFSV